MIVPDSSLLLYAYNASSPYHERAKSWWESCLSGAESVGLTHPVVFAFVRIGTSASGFPDPYSLTEVESHLERWLKQPTIRILNPSTTHILDVVRLLRGAGSAGGNLTTDAQIAALAIAHKATVHTADHDFRRFKGLKCHFPLDATT